MDIRLIDFFGAALVEPTIDVRSLNEKAMRLGYIIHPDCCTESVSDWLDSISTNYNSTFYKNWEDVVSRNRIELAIDQIIHYAVAYSTGISLTQNDRDYSDVPSINTYKVILPISKTDLFIKCRDVLYSGIALKSETSKVLCNFIYHNYDSNLFNIDEVKNKEAQIILCDVLGILPYDKFSLIRYIYYKVTGDPMIVKDKGIIYRMEHGVPFDMSQLSYRHKASLASIFHRYKPLFMGLKKQVFSPKSYRVNAPIINEIRRMAKWAHEPMIIGFWENVVSTPCPLWDLQKRLNEDQPNNFKLIRLIQAIRENRMKVGGIGSDLYMIRNGKMWQGEKTNYPALNPKYDWWDSLESILYRELVNRLSKKAGTVCFPKDLHLTCPTSEKNFIGNIPFGSHYTMTNNNIVSIYWRGEWGTQDFDLSFNTFNGTKIGWNSSYYNPDASIVYSGDVVRAEPEAAESLHIRKDCPNGVIKVNRYRGLNASKFMFSVAQKNLDRLPKNYMVDPNNIKFETSITSDSMEKMIGYVIDNELYLSDVRIANHRVSQAINIDEYIVNFKRKGMAYIDLRKLLLDAGFKERKTSTTNNPADLDLRDLKKDTLINLFS